MLNSCLHKADISAKNIKDDHCTYNNDSFLKLGYSNNSNYNTELGITLSLGWLRLMLSLDYRAFGGLLSDLSCLDS